LRRDAIEVRSGIAGVRRGIDMRRCVAPFSSIDVRKKPAREGPAFLQRLSSRAKRGSVTRRHSNFEKDVHDNDSSMCAPFVGRYGFEKQGMRLGRRIDLPSRSRTTPGEVGGPQFQPTAAFPTSMWVTRPAQDAGEVSERRSSRNPVPATWHPNGPAGATNGRSAKQSSGNTGACH
jgi:hypothetical protein